MLSTFWILWLSFMKNQYLQNQRSDVNGLEQPFYLQRVYCPLFNIPQYSGTARKMSPTWGSWDFEFLIKENKRSMWTEIREDTKTQKLGEQVVRLSTNCFAGKGSIYVTARNCFFTESQKFRCNCRNDAIFKYKKENH